ncbi:RNA recognition motif of the spliceosomal PrP8-domain-containing protein [Irpex rosettiformis]|uniref:RNA recognition motif of the spliceosomal PrP8-domain-containing protein n=1 Tax=Irpex rosettiformis TaxID=378272 RepID=A0ACB8TUV7_9APHY|nr:RNA recognition motif of the spliceosomal PrP8-domain-containing protein [Irpex rosettiformis]
MYFMCYVSTFQYCLETFLATDTQVYSPPNGMALPDNIVAFLMGRLDLSVHLWYICEDGALAISVAEIAFNTGPLSTLVFMLKTHLGHPTNIVISMQLLLLQTQVLSKLPVSPQTDQYKHNMKLLVLVLEKLKQVYLFKDCLNQSQREELTLIEQAYDNLHECLSRIKRLLLTQHAFGESGIESSIPTGKLIPCYDIEPGINNLSNIWETNKAYHTLADYITAKNNSGLMYKDMSHVNTYGLICGLRFSAFVFQYHGLILNLLILGLQQTASISSSASPQRSLAISSNATPVRTLITTTGNAGLETVTCSSSSMTIRTTGGKEFSLKDTVWNLANEYTKERTAKALLRVSDKGFFGFLDAFNTLALTLHVNVQNCSPSSLSLQLVDRCSGYDLMSYISMWLSVLFTFILLLTKTFT